MKVKRQIKEHSFQGSVAFLWGRVRNGLEHKSYSHTHCLLIFSNVDSGREVGVVVFWARLFPLVEGKLP